MVVVLFYKSRGMGDLDIATRKEEDRHIQFFTTHLYTTRMLLYTIHKSTAPNIEDYNRNRRLIVVHLNGMSFGILNNYNIN